MNADRPDPRRNGAGGVRTDGQPPGDRAGRPRASVGRTGVQAGPGHPAAGGGRRGGDRPVLLCGVGDQPVRPGGPGRLQLVAGRRRPGGGRRAGHLRHVPDRQPLPPRRQRRRVRLAAGRLRHRGLDRRQRRPRPTQPGRPGHRRRHPPGRAGHAGRAQGRRRRGHPPGRPGRRPGPRGRARAGPASSRRPPPSDAPTPPPLLDTAARGGRLPAASAARRAQPEPTAARSGRGCRRPMPNRGRTASPGRPAPWPRPPAAAAAAPPASCNASAHRLRSAPNEPAQLACCGTPPSAMPPGASRCCPCTTPSPTTAASSPSPATDSWRTPRWARAARVGIRAAARSPSTPSAAWCPTGSRRPPPTGPGCWPGGPDSPRPTSAWPPATASTSWTSTAPPAPRPSATFAGQPWPRTARGRWSGPAAAGWHYYLAPTGLGNVRPRGLEQVDWRGRGGYVVAPPSRHRSGHPYQWVAGRDLDTPLRRGATCLAGAAAASPGRPTRPGRRRPGRRPTRTSLWAGGPRPRAGPGRHRPPGPAQPPAVGSRPATSTTWSPPAPSTTTRSTRACSRPPNAAGCWPRSPARPSRTLASGRQVGLAHPRPAPDRTRPDPTHASPPPPARTGGERTQEGR